MRTADGKYRIELFADQTAQIYGATGVALTGRRPLYQIAERLLEYGIDADVLVPD